MEQALKKPWAMAEQDQRISEAMRWEHMTPEEREKFSQSMRGSCGPFAPPAEAPKA